MASTIGEYLIQRLHDYGARHVFGIPGDYSLPFFHQLENSPLKLINTYIEMPRNIANTKLGDAGPAPVFKNEVSDPDALKEAMREAVDMINAARQPVILAGVEIHRFGLQRQLLRLIAKTNIPVASTLLSKSVLPEKIPAHLGVYEGAMGHEDVRNYVESSDCLILLGALMSDVDMGIFTAKLDPACSISVTSEKTSIRFHTYENIRLEDFMKTLTDSEIHQRGLSGLPHPEPPPVFHAVKTAPMTTARLFQRLNTFINEETIVIADPGDAMFSAADLYIQGGTEFLSPAYYTSMGFAVPASVGVQLANPKMRPLVLVGDGAFQMTGMELTTSFRYGLNPIVVVLNNKGYGTERPMQEGKFNDLINWNYHKIPDVIGAGRGFEIHTEGELENALELSRKHKESFAILNVHLDPKDLSPALKRFTQSLNKKIH